MSSMNESGMESAYEMIAEAIDEVDTGKEILFLSKLSLTLAYKLADIAQLREAIAIARKNML